MTLCRRKENPIFLLLLRFFYVFFSLILHIIFSFLICNIFHFFLKSDFFICLHFLYFCFPSSLILHLYLYLNIYRISQLIFSIFFVYAFYVFTRFSFLLSCFHYIDLLCSRYSYFFILSFIFLLLYASLISSAGFLKFLSLVIIGFVLKLLFGFIIYYFLYLLSCLVCKVFTDFV